MTHIIEEKDRYRMADLIRHPELASKTDITLLVNFWESGCEYYINYMYRMLTCLNNDILFDFLDNIECSDDTLIYSLSDRQYNSITEKQMNILLKFLSTEKQVNYFIQFIVDSKFEKATGFIKKKFTEYINDFHIRCGHIHNQLQLEDVSFPFYIIV